MKDLNKELKQQKIKVLKSFEKYCWKKTSISQSDCQIISNIVELYKEKIESGKI